MTRYSNTLMEEVSPLGYQGFLGIIGFNFFSVNISSRLYLMRQQFKLECLFYV